MAGVLSTSMAAGPPAAKRTRLAKKTFGWYLAMLESMGGEDGCANQLVYLVTVSRVLPQPGPRVAEQIPRSTSLLWSGGRTLTARRIFTLSYNWCGTCGLSKRRPH